MMTGFKKYFFKVLRWPLLHSPGPLAALVEGLARTFDEVCGDIVWLRNQFNPWTCDPDMIPAHAASRGIIRHPSEPEDKYAERCIRAFAWQKLGGGQIGMPRIMEHYGFPGVSMTNMRFEEEERWAEFKVRVPVPETGLDSEDCKLIVWNANETKPGRSRLAGINAESKLPGSANAAGKVITAVISRITPDWPDKVSLDTPAVTGGYIHAVIKSTVK